MDQPTSNVLTDEFLERYHQALGEIINGKTDIYEELFSEHYDVTLGNPFGPFARGREGIVQRLKVASRKYNGGQLSGFDTISKYETSELAYLVEVERFEAKVGDSDELAPVALRTTSIFRPEAGVWKLVHRHADPIVTDRPAESVLG